MVLKAWPLVALFSTGALSAQAQRFDGVWVGTVDCVTDRAGNTSSTPVRATITGDRLTLPYASTTVTGRILDIPLTYILRLEGATPSGVQISFDSLPFTVSPDQIHVRGLVGSLPCNLNIKPAPPAPPPTIQAEQPTPPPSRRGGVRVVQPPPPQNPNPVAPPRPPVANQVATPAVTTPAVTTPAPTPGGSTSRSGRSSVGNRMACAVGPCD